MRAAYGSVSACPGRSAQARAVPATCPGRQVHRAAARLVVACMAKPWRPSIDDVDSISWGGRAKVRGTGSRNIPHRLNAEERTLYDMAKKKGFLTVRGTAYRRERHGNPLPNIFRQWCDARGQLCVVVEQDRQGGAGVDAVVVDLAPLRLEDTARVEALLADLAAELGLRRLGYEERPLDALPWNIRPPGEGGDGEDEGEDEDEAAEEEEGIVEGVEGVVRRGGKQGSKEAGVAAGSAAAAAASAAGATGSAAAVCDDSPEVAALRAAVAEQAAAVRTLKDSGLGNQDAAVKAQVQRLLQAKADLQAAEAAAASAPQPPPPAQASQRPTTSIADHHHPSSSASSSASTSTSTSAPPSASTSASAASLSPPPLPSQSLSPAPRRSPLQHYYSLPIWQIHAIPLFYDAERGAAKAFAAEAVKKVAEGTKSRSKALVR